MTARLALQSLLVGRDRQERSSIRLSEAMDPRRQVGSEKLGRAGTANVAGRPLSADGAAPLSTPAPAVEVPHGRPRRAHGPRERLSARESAERELAAHNAVAEALAAWDGTEPGFARVLADLAETLDCKVGVLWVPRDDRLRPRIFWHAETENALADFKLMTMTSRIPRGVEVPGQAWQQLGPYSRTSTDGLGPPRWRAAMAAGFRGVIALPVKWAGELIAVIELVSREDPDLTARLERSLAAIGSVLGYFLARRRGLLGEPVLTGRQLEILKLAAEGLSVNQIAERLVVSPFTVEAHLKNTYGRLGVKNRTAAVARAMRLGLVD